MIGKYFNFIGFYTINMLRNTFILSVCMLFFALSAGAQNMTTASGGNAAGTGGSVSFSIGQIVYSASTGTGGSVNQGNQQPYELFVLSTSATPFNFNMKVFPNPTIDGITVDLQDLQLDHLSYRLMNMQGQILSEKEIHGYSTTIPMESLPASTYFLYIVQNQQAISEYKIIKN